MFKHELGRQAKDKLTGFEGVITGRADYITGCNQYILQPEKKADGTFITANDAIVLDDEKKHGADMPAPVK